MAELAWLDRLQAAIAGNKRVCDASCQEQLQHMLTVHIRARFSKPQKAGRSSRSRRAAPGAWSTAVELVDRITGLVEQYAAMTDPVRIPAVALSRRAGAAVQRMAEAVPMHTEPQAQVRVQAI